MSSLVLMKILESSAARYDAGMRVLTLGRIGRAHTAIADLAAPETGRRVLEIGCGTGLLTEQLVARGAIVEALDQNPEMLDLARARLRAAPQGRVTLHERTAAEIDGLPAKSFDTVAASLVFSEMSSSERAYVLRHVVRVLRPGGQLIVADEVRPRRSWQRLVHSLARGPLVLLTWIVTGSTTRAIADLRGEVERAGLRVREERRGGLDTFAVLCADKSA